MKQTLAHPPLLLLDSLLLPQKLLKDKQVKELTHHLIFLLVLHLQQITVASTWALT
jgi:hypothetical protein